MCTEHPCMHCTQWTTAEQKNKRSYPKPLKWSPSGLDLLRHCERSGEGCVTASPYQKHALCLTSHNSQTARLVVFSYYRGDIISDLSMGPALCLEELLNTESKPVI